MPRNFRTTPQSPPYEGGDEGEVKIRIILVPPCEGGNQGWFLWLWLCHTVSSVVKGLYSCTIQQSVLSAQPFSLL